MKEDAVIPEFLLILNRQCTVIKWKLKHWTLYTCVLLFCYLLRLLKEF